MILEALSMADSIHTCRQSLNKVLHALMQTDATGEYDSHLVTAAHTAHSFVNPREIDFTSESNRVLDVAQRALNRSTASSQCSKSTARTGHGLYRDVKPYLQQYGSSVCTVCGAKCGG